MVQNHQKGKTIFGVITIIAVIALLCLLCVYICHKTHASEKSKEIAQAVAARAKLYCPRISNNIAQFKSRKYFQNGPYKTTIILENEEETPQFDADKIYFSVVVETPSESICKKLIKTDVFKADMITINEDINGTCPGFIRFFFTCPYELEQEEMIDQTNFDHQDPKPHFTFTNPAFNKQEQDKCTEPTPYKLKDGRCVECLTSSQCQESQDCVENMCIDCPEFSNRTVRIGQRIGTRNCYCQENYQLNEQQNGCIAANTDWDASKNCVGNNCSICPEHAGKKSGQRIGMTNCYCENGYIPRQTGATQWQCAKVTILYPESENQIIIHDEKYPVSAASQEQVLTEESIGNIPMRKPISPRYNNSAYQLAPEIINTPLDSIMIQEPIFVPVAPDGIWNVQGWESLEITIQ